MLDYGWDDGTIGEFSRLSELAQANRAFLQNVADTASGGLLPRVVAAGTLRLRDLTSGAAPVDTGTLRSAHRGELDAYGGDGIQGTVFIDPGARNPVSDTRPAVYGEVWADRYFNWFERVADMHGDSVLDQMEMTIMMRAGDIWH
jgi:hypothetical protein